MRHSAHTPPPMTSPQIADYVNRLRDVSSTTLQTTDTSTLFWSILGVFALAVAIHVIVNRGSDDASSSASASIAECDESDEWLSAEEDSPLSSRRASDILRTANGGGRNGSNRAFLVDSMRDYLINHTLLSVGDRCRIVFVFDRMLSALQSPLPPFRLIVDRIGEHASIAVRWQGLEQQRRRAERDSPLQKRILEQQTMLIDRALMRI